MAIFADVIIREVEVVSVGTRKDKDGKDQPIFQGLIRNSENSTASLHQFKGNGVVLGGIYDLDCTVSAYKDSLFFRSNAILQEHL